MSYFQPGVGECSVLQEMQGGQGPWVGGLNSGVLGYIVDEDSFSVYQNTPVSILTATTIPDVIWTDMGGLSIIAWNADCKRRATVHINIRATTAQITLAGGSIFRAELFSSGVSLGRRDFSLPMGSPFGCLSETWSFDLEAGLVSLTLKVSATAAGDAFVRLSGYGVGR